MRRGVGRWRRRGGSKSHVISCMMALLRLQHHLLVPQNLKWLPSSFFFLLFGYWNDDAVDSYLLFLLSEAPHRLSPHLHPFFLLAPWGLLGGFFLGTDKLPSLCTSCMSMHRWTVLSFTTHRLSLPATTSSGGYTSIIGYRSMMSLLVCCSPLRETGRSGVAILWRY